MTTPVCPPHIYRYVHEDGVTRCLSRVCERCGARKPPEPAPIPRSS